MNYYMHNNGKICSLDNCYDVNIFSFPLSYGSEVCFQDGLETTKFKISKSSYRYRYLKDYRTCDFSLKIDSYWECEGSGSCGKGDCRIGTKHATFKNLTKIAYYSCKTNASPCDTYCWFETQCVYTMISVLRGDRCSDIYRYTSGIWEVDIMMTTNNITKVVSLNVNNPSIKMRLSSITDNEIPLYITSHQSEVYNNPQYVLKYDGKVYPVHAAPINFPTKGFIGEYQVSSTGKSESIDPAVMSCQVDNCKPACLNIEQSYVRFVDMISDGRIANFDNYRLLNSDSTTDININSKPTLTMSVGNVNFKNLLVVDSKCKLRVAMTFGC